MGEYKIGELIESLYGSYRVDDIMKGGMGIVYVVSNLEDDQNRILETYQDTKKVFKTYQDKFKLKGHVLERFLKESRIWIDLSIALDNPLIDPFIVRAYCIHEVKSQPFLELEFIKGGNLSNWIGYLSLPTILDLSVQFCRGMHALNAKLDGFVHRDLKPENILVKDLLGGILVLKISDFGLAEVKEELMKQSDNQKVIVGTRLYMSPEQFNGSKMLDLRSDMFSFGLVLLEMLTVGREHGSSRWFDFMLQIQNSLIYDAGRNNLKELLENTPNGLDDVIMKCLKKKPAERYEGFDVLENAIQEIIHQEGFDNEGKYDLAYSGKHMTIDMDYLSEDVNVYDLKLKRAFSYAELGEPLRGVELLDEILEVDPKNAVVLANKGNFLLSYFGRVDEAMQVLDLSINIDPMNEYTWTYKGMAHEASGEFKAAGECFTKAISINPNFSPAWRNKGALYSNAGQYQQALNFFRQAEAIQEEDSLLHRCKGITYVKLGSLQKAIVSFKRAFEINSQDIDSMVDCANCLMQERDFEKGEKILHDVVQLDENHVVAWLIYGGCKFDQGKYKEAAVCFERVQLLNPELAAQHDVTRLIMICHLSHQE